MVLVIVNEYYNNYKNNYKTSIAPTNDGHHQESINALILNYECGVAGNQAIFSHEFF